MEQKRHGRDTWAHFDNDETGVGLTHATTVTTTPTSVAPFPVNQSQGSTTTVSAGSHMSSTVSSAIQPTTEPSAASNDDQQQPRSAAPPRPVASVVVDPWAISSEQKAYYLSQFLRLQPDPRAKLSGLQAKPFFELSSLSNVELSDIWELSDADCDGQLTLGEFCVAMHLVVLRRNDVPVPRLLPSALLEVITSQSLFTLATNTDKPESLATLPVNSPEQTGPPATVTLHGSPLTSPRLTPTTSVRPRRWSISSQSDVSSLAEGILHFEARPTAETQLPHPIPLRARTLPPHIGDTVGSRVLAHSSFEAPPPPPPRAHLVAWNQTVLRQSDIPHQLQNFSPKIDNQPKRVEEKDDTFQFSPAPFIGDSMDSPEILVDSHVPCPPTVLDENRDDCATPADPVTLLARLRTDCDGATEANEKLANELTQLQQYRIALKILLERLMPLDAGYPECDER